jgi:hypothetical protein
MWWNHHILAPQLPPSHWMTCARAQDYWFCSSKWVESNRAIGLHGIRCHAKLFRAHDDEVRFPGRRCQYLTTGWDLLAFLDTRWCNFVWGIQRTNFRRDPTVPCEVIACAILVQRSGSFLWTWILFGIWFLFRNWFLFRIWFLFRPSLGLFIAKDGVRFCSWQNQFLTLSFGINTEQICLCLYFIV